MSEGMRPAALVFFAAFAAYLFTMPPDLPPYRDAGEMASSAYTLGVSHPPSYPLYILLGHAIEDLPLGSPAHRLGLLSALASAGALAALFLFLREELGAFPAAAAAACLGANATFWSVSIVPEMYSLTALFAVGLLSAAFRLHGGYEPRKWNVFAFFYGLALGNRTDLVLWAPALLYLAAGNGSWKSREGNAASWALRTICLGGLGLSVYLYLPLRSSAGPWLDWNHPAELSNLIGSLTRRSYGGTLDLLSRNYAAGEMFLENVKVYAAHLWKGYLGFGLILPLAGAFLRSRRDPAGALGLFLAWAASGPLFLFLANLPPNPHAMAIVEPHYVLSDIILAVWAAEGLAALRAWRPELAIGRVAAVVLAALPLLRPWTTRPPAGTVDRRWNLFGYDYCRNVLSGLPEGAALIAKKDVQLFSLWYTQTVQGLRPDVRLVAQGLSASPWYRSSMARAGARLALTPLRDGPQWQRFAAVNGEVFATPDAEIPSDLRVGPPRGIVLPVSPSAAVDESPWSFIARRGDMRYEAQPDFFDADIVEAYVGGRQRLGSAAAERGLWDLSLRNLRFAWAMKWLAPEIPTFIGFDLFRMGRLTEAAEAYGLASRLFDRTLELTRLYRSLPGVGEGIRKEASDAQVNWGVIEERLKNPKGAERHYREAVALDPSAAQPHYNLAVLSWGKDWAGAIAELAETLRLNPNHADAAKYLAIARRQSLGK